MSYINKFTTKITKFFTRDTKLYVYRPVSGYKEHEAEAQSLVSFNSENGIAIIAYFVKSLVPFVVNYILIICMDVRIK